MTVQCRAAGLARQTGRRAPKWRPAVQKPLLAATIIGTFAISAISHAQPNGSLYYCDPAHAYYPYVTTCPAPWRAIAPSQQQDADAAARAPAPTAAQARKAEAQRAAAPASADAKAEAKATASSGRAIGPSFDCNSVQTPLRSLSAPVPTCHEPTLNSCKATTRCGSRRGRPAGKP